MARLDRIVEAINLTLASYLPGARLHGLATIVSSEAGDKPIIGQATPVDDGYTLSAWHRLNNTDTELDEEAGVGADPELIETHELVWVAYGHREVVGGPSDLLNAAKVVFNAQVQQPLRHALQLRHAVIRAGSAAMQADAVIAAQMPGLELSSSEEYTAIALQYTVTLRYLRSCDELSCGIDTPDQPIGPTFCQQVNECVAPLLLAEQAARIGGDNILAGRIDVEAATRAQQDNAISAGLATEINARAEQDALLLAAIATEATTRADEDAALQAQIDTLGPGVAQYLLPLTAAASVTVPAAQHGLLLVLDARCTDASDNEVETLLVIDRMTQQVSGTFTPALTGYLIINGIPT